MNKVAITYFNNSQAVFIPAKVRARNAKPADEATPQWFVFAVIASITFMLCLTINLRAYSELSAEIEQNQSLSVQFEQLTNDNLAIQDEIHSLKTDSATVERAARKIGMSRPNEKILVSVN